MRRAAKVDTNQKKIVRDLRKHPCIEVEVNHHDILVGFKGKTYWYEIKNADCLGKDGKILESKKKDSQKRLEKTWKGHYEIVTCLDDILRDLGIIL